MIRNQETIIRLLQNNKEHDPVNEATPHTNQEFPNLASYGMPFKTLVEFIEFNNSMRNNKELTTNFVMFLFRLFKFLSNSVSLLIFYCHRKLVLSQLVEETKKRQSLPFGNRF